MVLEKDSSILGYPGETSKALDADHHNVCKYNSPRDPNYIVVRNALTSLIGKIVLTSTLGKPELPNRKDSQDLKSLLAITDLPDIDYIFYRDQWTPGTNQWLLQEQCYLEWLNDGALNSSLLWLYGGAAAGKSVLSSFIINSLVEQGFACQYFFIRFGNQKKRSLGFLLRSIAYQMARSMPSFQREVLQLTDEAVDFETANPRTIWDRIFRSVLFKMEKAQTIYWVVDGLDEADDPKALVRLLCDVSLSTTPIRVLLVGRRTSEITASLQKIPLALNLRTISIEGHLVDLRCYVLRELSMSGTAKFQDTIVQRILEGAQSNFLVSNAFPCTLLASTDSSVGSTCRWQIESMSYAG